MRYIYIAGPMTGYKRFNFEQFDTAKWHLDGLFGSQAEIFSPADHDRNLLGKSWDWYPEESDTEGPWVKWAIPNAPSLRTMLGEDLSWIAKNATHIFMLKGWENSKGARAEHALAHALGLEFMYK